MSGGWSGIEIAVWVGVSVLAVYLFFRAATLRGIVDQLEKTRMQNERAVNDLKSELHFGNQRTSEMFVMLSAIRRKLGFDNDWSVTRHDQDLIDHLQGELDRTAASRTVGESK